MVLMRVTSGYIIVYLFASHPNINERYFQRYFQVTVRHNLFIYFDQFQSYSSRGNDEMEVTARDPPRNLFDDI
jgi:hypothetical protein